ncbi:hypothetical protein ACHAWF_006388 [Thalassiosira exigua]
MVTLTSRNAASLPASLAILALSLTTSIATDDVPLSSSLRGGTGPQSEPRIPLDDIQRRTDPLELAVMARTAEAGPEAEDAAASVRRELQNGKQNSQQDGDNDVTHYDEPSCDADPSNCGCAHLYQSDYRGTLSTTEKGYTCWRWHPNVVAEHPDWGLEDGNYCRNPTAVAGRAWCMVRDPDDPDVQFDYCDVDACPAEAVEAPDSVAVPGCVSESSYRQIEADVIAIAGGMDDDVDKSHFMGGVLRLAAHDFMDYDQDADEDDRMGRFLAHNLTGRRYALICFPRPLSTRHGRLPRLALPFQPGPGHDLERARGIAQAAQEQVLRHRPPGLLDHRRQRHRARGLDQQDPRFVRHLLLGSKGGGQLRRIGVEVAHDGGVSNLSLENFECALPILTFLSFASVLVWRARIIQLPAGGRSLHRSDGLDVGGSGGPSGRPHDGARPQGGEIRHRGRRMFCDAASPISTYYAHANSPRTHVHASPSFSSQFSGHHGTWVQNDRRAQTFDKTYFEEMVVRAWSPHKASDDPPLQDWTTGRNPFRPKLMLNTDVCLLYDIEATGPCCTRTDLEDEDGLNRCESYADVECLPYSNDHPRADASRAVVRMLAGSARNDDNDPFYSTFREAVMAEGDDERDGRLEARHGQLLRLGEMRTCPGDLRRCKGACLYGWALFDVTFDARERIV